MKWKAEKETKDRAAGNRPGRSVGERIHRALSLALIALAVLGLAGRALAKNYILPKRHYGAALRLRAESSYDEAVAEFAAAGAFRDARQQVKDTRYAQGQALLEAEEWDAAADAFRQAGDDRDAAEQAKEARYRQAQALAAAGDHDAASALYAGISGYRDAEDLLWNDADIAAAYRAQFQVGNHVSFGRFEQDNAAWNGPEAIDWIVVERDEDTATLLSAYGLDAGALDADPEGRAWEDCALCQALNGDFLDGAFSEAEKARLLPVGAGAGDPSEEAGEAGAESADRVTLASLEDVERWFADDSERIAFATAFARAKGAWTDNSGRCWWWLRTPGYRQAFGDYVFSDGTLDTHGMYVYSKLGAVRPVVVVSLG